MKSRPFNTVVSIASVALISAAMPSSLNGASGNDKDRAGEIFRQWYDSRTSLTEFECAWKVQMVQYLEHPNLIDCVHEYHGWYDYVKDRCRVDVTSACPLDGALTAKRRFSFTDNEYLIINAEDVLGLQLDGLARDFMHSADSYSVFHLSTDPRLIGLFPAEETLLKNYSLTDVLSLVPSASECNISTVAEENAELTVVKLVGVQGTKATFTYWLNQEQGNMPVRIVSEAPVGADKLRVEIASEWKEYSTGQDSSPIWLPQKMVSQRWLRDTKQIEEHCQVRLVNSGSPPKDSVFTWAGMSPPDKFVVQEATGKSRRMKQWNANRKQFEPWKPVYIDEQASQEQFGRTGASSNWRQNMFIANVAVIVVLIGLMAHRIRSAKC